MSLNRLRNNIVEHGDLLLRVRVSMLNNIVYLDNLLIFHFVFLHRQRGQPAGIHICAGRHLKDGRLRLVGREMKGRAVLLVHLVEDRRRVPVKLPILADVAAAEASRQIHSERLVDVLTPDVVEPGGAVARRHEAVEHGGRRILEERLRIPPVGKVYQSPMHVYFKQHDDEVDQLGEIEGFDSVEHATSTYVAPLLPSRGRLGLKADAQSMREFRSI